MDWFEVSEIRVLVIGGWGAICCEGSLGPFCNITCMWLVWCRMLGIRGMSFVPSSSNSRTHILVDFPHGCSWFADAVVGLFLCVYLFNFHSSAIPSAISPHVTFLEVSNWSMLMPVA